MNIQPVNKTSFKGYDARPLRGFLMSSNYFGIADEMAKIGQKEGFKIFSPFGGIYKNKCAEIIPPNSPKYADLWAQDYWSIVKDKLFFLEKGMISNSIMDFFKLKPDFTEKIVRETQRFKEINGDIWGIFATASNLDEDDPLAEFKELKEELSEILKKAHISGGNIFIVKNEESDIALVGEDELQKYGTDEIKCMYKVDEVVPLPQMDFHTDLFIRPLDNKKILIADDNLTLEILEEGLKKLNNSVDKLPKTQFEEVEKHFIKIIESFKEDILFVNKRPNVDEVSKILEDKGFDVIRVPARIYDAHYDGLDGKESFLRHICNYINANVAINKEGDLVYITNKSEIDNFYLGLTPELSEKIGFSFEKSFVNSISKYVKPEHIYFVDGEKNFISTKMLPIYQGGIHCACSEVPEEL